MNEIKYIRLVSHLAIECEFDIRNVAFLCWCAVKKLHTHSLIYETEVKEYNIDVTD